MSPYALRQAPTYIYVRHICFYKVRVELRLTTNDHPTKSADTTLIRPRKKGVYFVFSEYRETSNTTQQQEQLVPHTHPPPSKISPCLPDGHQNITHTRSPATLTSTSGIKLQKFEKLPPLARALEPPPRLITLGSKDKTANRTRCRGAVPAHITLRRRRKNPSRKRLAAKPSTICPSPPVTFGIVLRLWGRPRCP